MKVCNLRRLSLPITLITLGVTPFAQVNAELYVSPVVSSSVNLSGDNMVSSTQAGTQVIGAQTRYGRFSSSQVDDVAYERASDFLGYGNDVPLRVAIENVAPRNSGWIINLDDTVRDMRVSWSGGNDWRDVLQKIADQNGLFVAISNQEKAIGVSTIDSIASQLASKTPKVWRITKEKTLKENLELWCKDAGWSLHWDQSVKIDYPIHHDAVITGLFEGAGGSVDQVLKSISAASEPLAAIFYNSNRVVRIVHAGAKQKGANNGQ